MDALIDECASMGRLGRLSWNALGGRNAYFVLIFGCFKLLFGTADLACLSFLEFALLTNTKKTSNRTDQQRDDVESPY